MTSSAEPAPEEPGSALHGSIQGKKDLSYYYAHAPRDTKEAPAAMPVHTPIAKQTYTPGERVSQIKTFQFLDDNEFAKVYLPLEDLSKITVDNVESSFQPTMFTITIRGLQPTPLQFTVSKLHKEINPEECSVKVMKTKVLIKLKKVLEGGGKDEEDEHEDTGGSAAELGTAIHTVEGGEVSEAGTAQQDTAERTMEEPPEPTAEAGEVAADAGVGSAVAGTEGEEQPPGALEDLAIEGSAVAGPEGEEAGKKLKQRKKKELRFPHWYSLKA